MSDNFTQLWASFREQVQEARTPRERPSIYTAGESAMTQRDGGRVSIWEPAMSETPHTTTVGINTRTAGLRFQVQAEDCVAIAAQLMAVAEEMQGIQLPAKWKLVDSEDPLQMEVYMKMHELLDILNKP